MAFMTAPLNFPYSASKLLVIRRNSSTRVEVRNQAGAEVASFTDVTTVHEERVGGLALAIHGDVAGIQVSLKPDDPAGLTLDVPGATPACRPRRSM